MARTYPPTGSQPPSVELTVRQGPQPGQSFYLTKPTLIIGREAGSDVVVNHPEVSRRHASLTWDGRQFIIQDLGSANGTFVNGVRLTAPQVLQPGDVIGLGQVVLLGFQATLPVVRPARPEPRRKVEPPDYAPPPPRPRGRRRVTLPLLIGLLGLCGLLAVAAAAGYFFLWPREVARPLVLIRSPRYGEQVEVGQQVTVHSVARDEGKVTRVELWVDGQLQEAQTSPLPGGTSPFPLLARWQPSSPGTHALIARAFNARGVRAQASINVEAIELADRDGDEVADEADACPDEPGLAANGCLDRDGDDIPDTEDTCPDEAGLSEGKGCPVPGEGDQDGDGVPDEADASPDEPGSPLAAGSPDADGDGIRDAEDACPDEPGLPEHDGCSAPGDVDDDDIPDAEDECPEEPGVPEHAGCPDGDGDGIRDGDDACPDEPGLPAHAGCPDRDGDGIPNRRDACPNAPGLPESGCPDTGAGDRDGDGIPNDADLAADEPGLPEHGGAPPPGEGEDADGDGTPDSDELLVNPLFGLLGGFWGGGGQGQPVEKAVVPVEVEALEFEVGQPYGEVYCYVGLAGREMERFSFRRLGETRWDIAQVMGGDNSRVLVVDDEEPLEVRMECGAYTFGPGGEREEPPYDLGSFTVEHPSAEWDGRVTTVGWGGLLVEGLSFQVKYRICTPSCEEAGLPPPGLSLMTLPLGGHELLWNYRGVRGDINGFKLYVDGSHWGNFERGPSGPQTYVLPDSLEPPCGERLEFQVTAFSSNPFDPTQESPRSNTVVLESRPCPRRVRVTFLDFQAVEWVGDPDPPGVRDDSCWTGDIGPIELEFSVHGADSGELYIGTVWGQSRLCTRKNECNRIAGYCLHPGMRGSITTILDYCHDIRDGLSSRRADQLYCPDNFIEVTVGPRDDLWIRGSIGDADGDCGWNLVWRGNLILGFDEIVPGVYTISDDIDAVEVTARIEELQ
jgi:hypothetical protein